MNALSNILLTSSLLTSLNLFAVDYYVDSLQNLRNPTGEVSSPFRKINDAIEVLRPGDRIFIKPGIYKEAIAISNLKSSSEQVTEIAPWGVGEVILDGSSMDPRDLDGESIIYLHNVYGVRVSGLTLRNLQTKKKNVTPMGISIDGHGGDITIQNNHIYKIQTNRTVRGGMNAHGIAVYGNSDDGPIKNIKILNNHLHDLKLGASEAIVVNGNVDGFEIAQNYIHNVNNIAIDAIGFEGTSPLIDYARNGHIWGNKIHDIRARENPAYRGDYGTDGIYVDGGRDIIIERNYIENVDIGIELASEHSNGVTKNVIVRNNVIKGSYYTGLAMGGYNSGRGKTENCYILNNTFISNNTENGSVGEIMLQYYVINSVIANNAFFVGPSSVVISHRDYSGGKNNRFSSNYVDVQDREMAKFEWNGVQFDSIEEFNRGPGRDWSNEMGDLGLTSMQNGDFSPRVDSLLVDQGENWVQFFGDLDFTHKLRVSGLRVDIGAVEFSQ